MEQSFASALMSKINMLKGDLAFVNAWLFWLGRIFDFRFNLQNINHVCRIAKRPVIVSQAVIAEYKELVDEATGVAENQESRCDVSIEEHYTDNSYKKSRSRN